jgi:hypothetical protein
MVIIPLGVICMMIIIDVLVARKNTNVPFMILVHRDFCVANVTPENSQQHVYTSLMILEMLGLGVREIFLP